MARTVNGKSAGLAMINEMLQEFVSEVIARSQIRYGDVRRLQRDYLPGGINDREELELLIALNAHLVRADKTWAQWLVGAVAEFVARGGIDALPLKEDTGEWIGRLLDVSSTRLGRRIAAQVRRELERRHAVPSTTTAKPHPEPTVSFALAQPPHAGRRKRNRKKPALRAAKPRCAVQHRAKPKASLLAGATPGWCLAGYLPAVQRSHLMNFPSASACLALAPCR